MISLNTIKTIDLWTEQNDNYIACFNGAFVDGFEDENIPFDSYKVVKNCNCIITSNQDDLNIRNKHHAIVFYKSNIPVRLMVLNGKTDIDKCIAIALSQFLNDEQLENIYSLLNIKRLDVDLKQEPIKNDADSKNEIDVLSCDRPILLENMLEGSYTQSDSDYGKSNNDNNYVFDQDISIQYKLKTDKECFNIEHHGAFLNKNKTRIIPLQDNSILDIAIIRKKLKNNHK